MAARTNLFAEQTGVLLGAPLLCSRSPPACAADLHNGLARKCSCNHIVISGIFALHAVTSAELIRKSLKFSNRLLNFRLKLRYQYSYIDINIAERADTG